MMRVAASEKATVQETLEKRLRDPRQFRVNSGLKAQINSRLIPSFLPALIGKWDGVNLRALQLLTAVIRDDHSP